MEADHTYTVVKIVDDRNINRDTLSRRRLEADEQGAPLYKLKKAIYFLGDFIKAAIKGYWFIDSKGNVFQYEKTVTVPLLCRRITKIISPVGSVGSVLEIEGVPNRLRSLNVVHGNYTHAAVLKYKGGYILYGVHLSEFRETRRKI